MKLFIPGETLRGRTFLDNAHELAARAYPYPPRADGGIVARFRFLHELVVPPEGFAVRPPLPVEPTLLELLAIWATALEGVLWADGGQIAVFHVRREWANVAGVEVSL